jgi:hypothetical protein
MVSWLVIHGSSWVPSGAHGARTATIAGERPCPARLRRGRVAQPAMERERWQAERRAKRLLCLRLSPFSAGVFAERPLLRPGTRPGREARVGWDPVYRGMARSVRRVPIQMAVTRVARG